VLNFNLIYDILQMKISILILFLSLCSFGTSFKLRSRFHMNSKLRSSNKNKSKKAKWALLKNNNEVE